MYKKGLKVFFQPIENLDNLVNVSAFFSLAEKFTINLSITRLLNDDSKFEKCERNC